MTKKSESLSQSVARFCRDLGFDDIPPDVVQAAKDHTLDAIGVGLAAASLSPAQKLEKAIHMLGSGEDSTVLGFVRQLPPPSAALFNGLLIHSLEYDDTHIASVIHGSSVIVPAALAIAESENLSGRDLILGVVVGWELLVRLGLAAPGLFQANGFQGTPVCGPFAAAVIGSLLLGLDLEETVSAFGIAGSQSSGVFEFLSDGSTVKALHPGWAAHGGVVASYLARDGMTGPATILEGRFGLYGAYARTVSVVDRLRKLLGELGSVWYLPEVSLKTYPCCHYIHSFLECLQNLIEDGVTAEEIESIRCLVPVEEAPIICEPWERKIAPSSGYEAKFSLPYCLASLLVDGDINVSTFDSVSLPDKTLAMAGKVSYEAEAGTGFSTRFPGSIEVCLRSGRKRDAAVPDVRGSPERPLTPDEIHTKFEENAHRKLKSNAVTGVLTEFERLEDAPNLKKLSGALRAVNL